MKMWVCHSMWQDNAAVQSLKFCGTLLAMPVGSQSATASLPYVLPRTSKLVLLLVPLLVLLLLVLGLLSLKST